MKQEDLQVLDRFDAVWQRVTAGNTQTASAPASRPVGDTALLEELMDGTFRLWNRYTAFAVRTRGTASRQLTALAGSARDHIRKLQLEYFLAAGDTYAPDRTARPAGGLLSGLREAYHGELALAARFSAGADSGCAPSRQTLYRQCAEDCLRSADRVRGLIRDGLR